MNRRFLTRSGFVFAFPQSRKGRGVSPQSRLAALLISVTALAGCAQLHAAGDRLRRFALAGGATARSATAGQDRRDAQTLAAARTAEILARGKEPPEPTEPKPRRTGQRRRPHGAASRRLHQRRAGLSLSPGALYQVYASPGEITDIALQDGEQLVGSGPVAAGDTVRWVIGDTESGAGPPENPHHGQADPRRSDDQSRHQYRPAHLSSGAALDREDLHGLGLLAISAGRAHRAAPPERRRRSGGAHRYRARSRQSQFPLCDRGRHPPWRPLRAFDDGRKVYIEFPRGIAQGEMPPLFVIGAAGDSQLVNYRVRGNHMIVDRLFAAAELRFGADIRRSVRIVRSDGRPAI